MTILHLPRVGMSEGVRGEGSTVLLSCPALLPSCPAVLLSCPALLLSCPALLLSCPAILLSRPSLLLSGWPGAALTGLAVRLGAAVSGPLLAGGRPTPLRGHRA